MTLPPSDTSDKGGPVVKTNPDPTEAVKEALRLAVQTINEKFDGAAAAVTLAREEMGKRLDAMSAGINDKFSGNKELVDQLGKANAVALQAALETQKDLLKQLQVTFDGTIKGVNEKIETLRQLIDRLTSRLDTGQGNFDQNLANRANVRETTLDTRKEFTDNRAFYVALLAAAVALAAFAFGVGGFHK
ncbi:MAG TPA: hypothetical protein VMS08_05530 [Candidatus Saccharimonadia bacterium]|jgi:chromosome segregation ATPase|nr:hypothetical protein [Candidatus Saccharimonadia bacterium]